MQAFLLIFGASLVILLLYMWLEGRKNSIIYTELSFGNLPNQFSGMKLFFISDIHRRELSETMTKKIKAKVDIIIIGGDLAEEGVPLARIEKNIKALADIAPTYFVWGNNDYQIDHLQLEKILKRHGVKILENQSIPLKRNDELIYLVGVDDVGHHFDNLAGALKGCQPSFKILISHNPAIKKQIRDYHDINLILSGHTHGGQIRFFRLGITKKAGLKELKNDLYLLISNGYGTTRLPLRLGAPAQTHVITLKGKLK